MLQTSSVRGEGVVEEEGGAGSKVVVQLPIDVARDRYPYCIVWTPIPVLTWLFPFVGHMGIADSRGVTFDFAGPYTISENDLAFGKTTRVVNLASLVRVSPHEYDSAVHRANACYAARMHNICFQNCHSHVATVLDDIQLMGFRRWNMIILAIWMFLCGSFTSKSALAYSVLPSVVVYAIVAFLLLFAQR